VIFSIYLSRGCTILQTLSLRRKVESKPNGYVEGKSMRSGPK
jgi:hypothetical protein